MANMQLQRVEMLSVEGVVFGGEIAGGVLAAEGLARFVKGMFQQSGLAETALDVGTKAGTGLLLRLLSGYMGGMTSDALGVAAWGAYGWAILSLIVALVPQISLVLQKAETLGSEEDGVERDRNTAEMSVA